MNIRVRVAEIKDLPALMLMIFAYLEETEKALLTDSTKDEVRKTVLDSITTGAVIVLLAEARKKGKFREAGYGIFDMRPDIFGDLIAWGHHLYVKPEYRSQDVAERIVLSAEHLASITGANEFYIDTAAPKLFSGRRGYSQKYVVLAKRLQSEAETNV